MTFSILPIIIAEMSVFKFIFPKEKNLENYYVIFIGSMLFTVVLFLRHILKDHNKKSTDVITLGKFMTDPSVLKQTRNNTNFEEEKVHLENVKKEISNLISTSEKNISAFKIPQDYQVVLGEATIELFKQNVSSVSDFLCKLNTQTDQFIEENTEKFVTENNDDNFKAYLYGLARTVESLLFSSNTCRSRVHFRLLNTENNVYDKYYICEDGKSVDTYLTPMKANSGIIKAAIDGKVSFVKSANYTLHQKAQNDAIWVDYITMVFFGKIIQEENREPFLSMTISIASIEYRQLLYFLSFINIERYIQLNIEKIYEHCPIKPK